MASIGVYAINANEIVYNNTTVDQALNELYQKKSEGVQVATLTTQGATYTMQNDGYITGSLIGVNPSGYAVIYFDGNEIAISENGNNLRNVSLYVPKDTVVTTRNEYGTYNLTVYEWK